MTFDEYQYKAIKFVNPALDLNQQMIDGAMGICGEAGETIELIKKHIGQGHGLSLRRWRRRSETPSGIWRSLPEARESAWMTSPPRICAKSSRDIPRALMPLGASAGGDLV